MNRQSIVALFVAGLFAVACGDSDGNEATNGEPHTNQSPPENTDVGSSNNDTGPDGPTYHADIKPLMQAHCTECHVENSIAPFALDTYEVVRATAPLSYESMVDGTMPPWPPADDCQSFQGHRGMSQEEIDLFQAWMDADYLEGEPEVSDLSHEEDPGDQDLTAPDLTLEWGFDFTPDPQGGDGVDDYRCFVIDPELDEEVFVSMVHTRPGNPGIVHHMIAYVISSDQMDEVDILKAEDSGPGYSCFGGPRVSSPEMLAGWVPGDRPQPYEPGHGVRLSEDSLVVVQMHYNTVNDPEGTDRTELDLYFIDEEEFPDPTELVIIPQGAFDLFLAAGDAEAEAVNVADQIPFGVTLHGIAPHMHLLGTEIRADISYGGGEMCLVHIPEWDFNWQGFYLYEEPIRLIPPLQTTLTCRYDNSPENQPPGRTPQDVTWGDGTYDEMGLVYNIVERPPGV